MNTTIRASRQAQPKKMFSTKKLDNQFFNIQKLNNHYKESVPELPDYLQEIQTGWEAERFLTKLMLSNGVRITNDGRWTDKIGNEIVSGEFIHTIED